MPNEVYDIGSPVLAILQSKISFCKSALNWDTKNRVLTHKASSKSGREVEYRI